MSVNRMTRAELANRTNCNLETIRHYEKIGVMPDPPRSETGYRQYNEEHERRLRFIMRGRELDFSISELKALLDLVDRRAVTCGEVERLAKTHLLSVRQKISDLRRMERVLDRTLKSCSRNDVPECPIIDALFERT